MTRPEVAELLTEGELEIVGPLPYASNATFLARVEGDDDVLAVYKPRRGERPLWDFPSGTLCLREYAAWVVDDALGWGLVPPTVLREGPAGFGAVQLFIEQDTEADVNDVVQTHPEQLRRMALFDLVINNADRKAGHILIDTEGGLWGVDHGVSFHDEPKLRTVIWAFEDEPLPEADVASLDGLADHPRVRELSLHLSGDEVRALRERIEIICRVKRFPAPGPGRRPVPWPPW